MKEKEETKEADGLTKRNGSINVEENVDFETGHPFPPLHNCKSLVPYVVTLQIQFSNIHISLINMGGWVCVCVCGQMS